jgi:hypothetical protein
MEDYDNFTFSSSSSSSSFPEFWDWRLWQLHFSSCFEMEEYNIFTFLLLLLWVLRYGEREKTLCNTVVNQKKKKGKILEIFILSKFSLFFFLFQSQNWTGRFSKTATGSMVQTVRNGSGRFFTDFDRFCRLAVHSKRPDRCCDRFPVQPVQPAGPVRF